MNRTLRWCIALLLLAVMPALAAKTKTMSIQVRQGQLRSTPSYLSRIKTTLNYTDRVTILEEKGVWMRVRPEAGTIEGWIHSASLTKKKLALKSGDTDATTAVSTEEQALAGKGFNSDVEAKFKENNDKVSFEWVDKMEKITIPTPKIISFLKAGDVKAKEGAVQ